MQVSIELQDLGLTQDKLNQIASEISNTKPLMLKLGNHLYSIAVDSFEHEKDPSGNPWTPLKESTKKYKTTAKMLYDEGDMQRNLINRSTSSQAIVGIDSVFSDFSYPVMHQFGSKDGKLPARPFMPIKEDMSLYDDVEDELEDIVFEFIESALK